MIRESISAEENDTSVNVQFRPERPLSLPAISPRTAEQLSITSQSFSVNAFDPHDDGSVASLSTSLSFSSIAPDLTTKYFGGEARDLFNQRYQMLSRQRKIVAKSGKETVSNAYFTNAHNRNRGQEMRPRSPKKTEGFLLSPNQSCSLPVILSSTSSDMTDIAGKASKESELSPEESVHLNLDLDKPKLYESDTDSELDELDELNELDSIAGDGHKASTIAHPLSPRSRFISSCIREGLNPRASLVLRKRISPHLKYSHLSIGDKVAGILAESLVDLPDVESIDISDNVLTDISLEPFLAAISTISSLTMLNLSSNIIGPKVGVRVKLGLGLGLWLVSLSLPLSLTLTITQRLLRLSPPISPPQLVR
jgi:hypothetical protein